VLIGGSAGGVVYGALTRLSTLPPQSTLVALLNDGGEKYLDTVFNDDWMQRHGLLDPSIEQEIDQLLSQYRYIDVDEYYARRTA
jgi:cystathionine beta-synthase